MRRPVVLSLAITVFCSMPVFLLGALSIQMRQDVGFSLAMLGVAIAVFRGSGAVVAIPLGRLADRLGPFLSMRIGGLIAMSAAIATAVVVHTWWLLVLVLVIAGMANALGQASANLMLASEVVRSRQGLAFGMKQSALPIASLLAGLAVPAVALTIGWRWAFVLLGIGAAALAVIASGESEERGKASPASSPRDYSEGPQLRLLSVGMAFAMAAATTLSAYTVDSAVAAGVSASLAGLLLTAGSLCAVAVRLTAGYFADRFEGGHLAIVAQMIALGVVGYVLLGFEEVWALLLGTLMAFAFGWGYNGLFWFATVRLNEEAPGRATGAVLVGGMVGGLTGPLVFGWIADGVGYAVSWRVSALWAAIGAFTLYRADRSLRAGPRSQAHLRGDDEQAAN